MVWVYLCNFVSLVEVSFRALLTREALGPSPYLQSLPLLSQFTFLLPSSSSRGPEPTCPRDQGWGVFIMRKSCSKAFTSSVSSSLFKPS